MTQGISCCESWRERRVGQDERHVSVHQLSKPTWYSTRGLLRFAHTSAFFTLPSRYSVHEYLFKRRASSFPRFYRGKLDIRLFLGHPEETAVFSQVELCFNNAEWRMTQIPSSRAYQMALTLISFIITYLCTTRGSSWCVGSQGKHH